MQGESGHESLDKHHQPSPVYPSPHSQFPLLSSQTAPGTQACSPQNSSGGSPPVPPLPPPVVVLDPVVPPVEPLAVVPPAAEELVSVVTSLLAPPTEPASVLALLAPPVVSLAAVVAVSVVLAPPLPPESPPPESLVAEVSPASVSLVLEACSAEPQPTRPSKAAQQNWVRRSMDKLVEYMGAPPLGSL